MSLSERRSAILEHLCTVRQDTLANLAQRFRVSERTIRYDLEALTLNHPIDTVRGNGGGIRVADWYRLNRRTLAPEQVKLLKRIAPALKGEDLIVLNSIISQFGQYSQ